MWGRVLRALVVARELHGSTDPVQIDNVALGMGGLVEDLEVAGVATPEAVIITVAELEEIVHCVCALGLALEQDSDVTVEYGRTHGDRALNLLRHYVPRPFEEISERLREVDNAG